MAERRESVRIDYSSNIGRDALRDAQAIATLNRELSSMSRRTTTLTRNSTQLDESLRRLGPSLRNLGGANGLGGLNNGLNRSSNSINQFTGRLKLIGQLVATIGPAAVPIASLAVPAVAGLATQLGFAAVAGGTAVLAFQGVGDALEAMNKARLEPTAENLEAARKAMQGLSPAARDLVTQLQSLRDEGLSLRDAAAEGFLPGVSDALDIMLDRLPEAQRILREVGDAAGDILADGAASLASSEWDDFFTFLETEARPTLMGLAESVGNVAGGMAELLMATNPLADDFSSWLAGATQGFQEWASGLSETQGFQDFIDYVRRSGPQVADAMGAIANALIDIVTAAAPLGGPVLAAIEGVARAISAVAGSELGTGILAAVAAMSLLSRVTAAYGAVARTAFVQAITGQASVLGAVNAARTAMGRAAAAGGLLALSMTDVDNKMGVANTAMGAMAGFMVAGPWGAAIGTGIGALADFSAANDGAEEAVRNLDAALRGTDFTAVYQSLARVSEQTQTLRDKADTFDIGGGIFSDRGLLADYFTGQANEAQDKIQKVQGSLESLALSLGGGSMTLVPGDRPWSEWRKVATASTEEVIATLERAGPALEALGYSAGELKNMDPSGLRDVAREVKAWQNAQDSAANRTAAFADSVAGLGDVAIRTADSASALSQALEALLSPNLNLSEATDAWAAGLAHLSEQMAKNSRTLVGQTDGARANREAIRGQIELLQARLVAEAEAGASSGRLANILGRSREALIRTGVAAGLSGKQLRGFLREAGLTPALIKTVFEAAGISKSEREARDLRATYEKLPKDVQTDIKTNGIPKSRADILDLQKKYDLTPKQVQTLVQLMDQAARAGITNIGQMLRALDGNTARTYVTNTITTVRRVQYSSSGGSGFGPQPVTGATGGYVRGPGTATSDSIPARLSDGEYVIRASAVDRYGVDFFHQANAMLLAQGGLVERFATGGNVGPRTRVNRGFNIGNLDVSSTRQELQDFARAVREAGFTVGRSFQLMSANAIKVAKAMDKQRATLDKMQERATGIRQGAAAAYNNDFLSGSLSDAMLQLEADANDARSSRMNLRQAGRRGLDGRIVDEIAASGNTALIAQLAKASRADIAKFERLYAMRGREQKFFGQAAVEESGLSGQMRGVRQEIAAMRRDQNRREGRIEAGVYKGARDGTADRRRRSDRDVSNRRRTGGR